MSRRYERFSDENEALLGQGAGLGFDLHVNWAPQAGKPGHDPCYTLTIEAERLPTEHRVHDPANHESRTDRKAAPIVAQAVWIEESLQDAPGGVAEKPNNDHEHQRTAKWLSEDGRERAARPRDASACLGCDLEGQCADDHVKHTLHEEAHAGEPLDRAETVHRSMVRRISRRTLTRDLELGGHRAELADKRVSRSRLASV